jgi:hypothetical protein
MKPLVEALPPRFVMRNTNSMREFMTCGANFTPENRTFVASFYWKSKRSPARRNDPRNQMGFEMNCEFHPIAEHLK